ncbi:YigZ family protein [Helicobacter mustelae]|uniref:Impact N-terminal domain-containing protein n=1 Tax=Helicobacter mustelae (strain ATCC 43772 / CCUG 25715 / CIP 103759 / LMG 18044 / NCTC 12198 / R85-136P) TaxID=679897 RepID=D3UHX7_HELM1|nr:YigZ family protein [Helicobacter mustelae]CBG40100.1 putative hypothetical protein [Helicobacter mustelae 12198]SQH71614.1 X-Pro dipeptidase [Helicobacter mustelae]
MKKIVGEAFFELEAKKSSFLGFLFPWEHFAEKLQELKNTHLKAVHFVYAYRVYDSGRVEEAFSDDGEPRGSSGMPVLNVLRGRDLVDSAAIVVRYFGGTLLGVGGLVRAYTQSIVECVKIAESKNLLQDFVQECQREFFCSYALLSRVEYLAKILELELQKDRFCDAGVVLHIRGREGSVEEFAAQVEQMRFVNKPSQG